MKKNIMCLAVLVTALSNAQEKKDSIELYRKPILQGVETDFLASYYTQDGKHSAVMGGVGTESLTDFTPDIIVSIPSKLDNVWTIEGGLDSYTSASSSNIEIQPNQSIWDDSSGASSGDIRVHGDVTFAHHAKDRNSIWTAGGGFSNEYDVTSFNATAGYTKLFNDKATEIGIKGQVFFDSWKLIYPSEFRTTNPISTFTPLEDDTRQTFALTLNASQIINSKLQVSATADVIVQSGLLSTPFNRVYFNDFNTKYPDWDGASFIQADDIEHLPNSRLKIPIGLRANYYINDFLSVRTYFRYYWDDWGVTSQTASIELPIKLSNTFTVYPMYRYYAQSEADYFSPFAEVDASKQYYTSDYDLSKFTSNQYGAGIRIAPPLGLIKYKVPFVGTATRRLKSIDLRYNHYDREDGLTADIVTVGMSFGL